MATNRRIQTSELDFDGIKQNLKNYLQGQSQFSDYDFEGSGMSVILDILALNTHYNALYTNLAVNESFLDSASKRSSVVSKAKEIGYTPHSSVSATAQVLVTLINDQVGAPASYTINAFTPFTSELNGTQFTFYNTSTQTAIRVGNQYLFNNMVLKEGTQLQNTYTYNGSSIIIPNLNVDTSTIKVTVQENSQSSTSVTYSLADLIVDLTSQSNVFFIRELEDQTYQLEFGYGSIGTPLSNGNVITVTYFTCNQEQPNGASSFNFAGTVPANASVFVTTLASAVGGSQPEDIESVRFNAPRAYSSQNRCVTQEDYRTSILALYPNALAVNIWGGQENNPPQYGKVFIAVVPDQGDFLTTAEKEYIINTIINPRKSLTVTPEIVDPTYIKIDLKTTVYYNPLLTTLQADDIGTLVNQTIIDYNQTNLNTFGSVFKYSKLIGAIDNSEPAITGNITVVTVRREIQPVFDILAGYIIALGNPIYQPQFGQIGNISSTGIYTTDTTDTEQVLYIDDQPITATTTGNMRLYYTDGSGNRISVKTIGTVNYATGLIQINNIAITGLAGSTFELIIQSDSNDILSSQNQFVKIDPDYTTITVVADSTQQKYQFTSSKS